MKAKIRFAKGFPTVEVETPANLMRALLNAGRPVASSCHGDGICGKCRIRVVDGIENLSRINTTEEILRARHHLDKWVRISCQTEVLGDITVDTSYW